MFTVTKEFTFEYGHRLDGYADGKKNTCGNPAGHGHSGILQVSVMSTAATIPNPETGMIVDFKELSKVVNEHVISKLDHAFLNIDVPEIGRPTAENMIGWIWEQLRKPLEEKKCALVELKLWETANSFITLNIHSL